MTTSEKRFELLLVPHHDLLRGYVHRLIGHPSDAEDVIQDVLIKALEKLPTLRSDSAFRGWIMKIATSTSLDHLRQTTRWRPLSQSYVEQECAESDELRAEIVATTKDPEFEFDVREHISFCFTCVARSLNPEEEAAIVLREILQFSNREAADALGLTESALRHKLSDGRRSMEKTFDGLCSLVNKKGMCRQCSGFRKATAPGRRGPSLPVLNNSENLWDTRLELVRERHFEDGASTSLHNLLFERIRRLECASEEH